MLRILARVNANNNTHTKRHTTLPISGGTQIKTAMKCQFSSIRLAEKKLKHSRVGQSMIEGAPTPSTKVCHWAIH